MFYPFLNQHSTSVIANLHRTFCKLRSRQPKEMRTEYLFIYTCSLTAGSTANTVIQLTPDPLSGQVCVQGQITEQTQDHYANTSIRSTRLQVVHRVPGKPSKVLMCASRNSDANNNTFMLRNSDVNERLSIKDYTYTQFSQVVQQQVTTSRNDMYTFAMLTVLCDNMDVD